MALPSGLFARLNVARDSGAPGDFCVCGTRFVGAVDDAILLSRWAARLPSLDDARIVVRFRNRLGALPCTHSTAVEHLNTGCRNCVFHAMVNSVSTGS